MTSENLENRRKRLRFRSWHRGTKENDLLMGRFADAHLDGFDAEQLDLYEAILELPDPDLMGWISGREPLPAEADSPVMQLLLNFDHAAANLDSGR